MRTYPSWPAPVAAAGETFGDGWCPPSTDPDLRARLNRSMKPSFYRTGNACKVSNIQAAGRERWDWHRGRSGIAAASGSRGASGDASARRNWLGPRVAGSDHADPTPVAIWVRRAG